MSISYPYQTPENRARNALIVVIPAHIKRVWPKSRVKLAEDAWACSSERLSDKATSDSVT
jgi:hypothetical protein